MTNAESSRKGSSKGEPARGSVGKSAEADETTFLRPSFRPRSSPFARDVRVSFFPRSIPLLLKIAFSWPARPPRARE